jgi:uncharacterized protein GlcG (DUF336 family)
MIEPSRRTQGSIPALLRSSVATGAFMLLGCVDPQGSPPASGPALAVEDAGAGAADLSLDLAVEAARLASSTCLDAGFATTVIVADRDGRPVATLSARGANPRTQQIAPTKIATVRKYAVPSSEVVARVRSDDAFAAEIAADPAIGVARGGALPLVSGGRLVGYIAVSGAPSGEQDEICAAPAAQLVAAREQ